MDRSHLRPIRRGGGHRCPDAELPRTTRSTSSRGARACGRPVTPGGTRLEPEHARARSRPAGSDAIDAGPYVEPADPPDDIDGVDGARDYGDELAGRAGAASFRQSHGLRQRRARHIGPGTPGLASRGPARVSDASRLDSVGPLSFPLALPRDLLLLPRVGDPSRQDGVLLLLSAAAMAAVAVASFTLLRRLGGGGGMKRLTLSGCWLRSGFFAAHRRHGRTPYASPAVRPTARAIRHGMAVHSADRVAHMDVEPSAAHRSNCQEASYQSDAVSTVPCTVSWGQFGYTATRTPSRSKRPLRPPR